jgi:hypothetical protein
LVLFPTNITTSHNQELPDLQDCIEQHIASLEVVDWRGQENETQDDKLYGAVFTQDSHNLYLSSWLPQVLKGKLSPSQRGNLELLIPQYPDLLNENLGLTHLMESEIQLLEANAVRLAPYLLAPPKMQYLWEHTNVLLKDRPIEPSLSNSPKFLVPKPGEAYCTVVDYRLLNKHTAIESVPLPDIHSAFHYFVKVKCFTTK